MRKRFGFTMIELLVVISVILILAGIITPVVNKVKRRAQRVKCLSNIRQCGQAIVMYTQDYDDRVPAANNKANWWALFPDKKNLPDEIRCCPNEANKVVANFYSPFSPPAGTNVYITNLSADAPLLCEYDGGDGNWNAASDYHEGEGGNVYYAGGNAKFVRATTPPTYNPTLTRL